MDIFSIVWYNIFFLLAGHKVDFIARAGQTNPLSGPLVEKKSCAFILLVWLLPSLCSGIKLHTRKINFFSLVAQCTIFQ